MQDAVLERRVERKSTLGDLCTRIEEVLADNDRAGARALLPEVRTLCGKIRRLRARGGDFTRLGVSPYVLAVATLAGREEEFAEFA